VPLRERRPHAIGRKTAETTFEDESTTETRGAGSKSALNARQTDRNASQRF
jgi:hypothetical protein